jgi:methionine aminopeptidase
MRTGGERRTTEGIRLHDSADFEGMRRAGRLAAECLDMIGPHVVPGVRTEELDALCHAFIIEHGATPAPLGYRGFPIAAFQNRSAFRSTMWSATASPVRKH